MRIDQKENMNEQQRHEQMIDNSTKLLSSITSSSISTLPDRTRTVINVIYISGIVFMLIVFIVLLWINLYSHRCWCWHDTPLMHRFNRQCLLKHSMNIRRDPNRSYLNNQQQHDNELDS